MRSRLPFHGPPVVHGTSQKTRRFPAATTLSPAEPIPGPCELEPEKRSLARTTGGVGRFVCVAAPRVSERRVLPVSVREC